MDSKQGHAAAGDERTQNLCQDPRMSVRSTVPRGQPSPLGWIDGMEGCEGASLDPNEPWRLMLCVSSGYHIWSC